jgi:hypothetical protein
MLSEAASTLRFVRPGRKVESLLGQIAALQRDRERLRERNAARGDLERNRRALARAQHELSLALVERHRKAA